MQAQTIVITDLDGTLLDSDYSFKKAVPALEMLIRNNIPLIICSSKTNSEILHLRKMLKNSHPYITENGGGVFIPDDYFNFPLSTAGNDIDKCGNYYAIRLGAKYAVLRDVLAELRAEGCPVRGFGDMSVKEVSMLTGLKEDAAKRAMLRDFDEPFVFKGSDSETAKMLKEIAAKGFNTTQGEFFHIMGKSDKGRALSILADLYKKQYGDIFTIALGDSPNDIEMLQLADHPVVVKKKDGTYNDRIINEVSECIRADGIGPAGWNIEVMKVCSALSEK
ncbi:MAG: HAD-IIB family hydrolase [Nitrospira sp.]|nr:HAD-IIB family hydrolase [bacterium]MBL7049629.1 HAD-IIB family hydrolase [Nitrospira sp.]